MAYYDMDTLMAERIKQGALRLVAEHGFRERLILFQEKVLAVRTFRGRQHSSNRHDNDERQSIRSILEAIAVQPTEGETEEST